jgi:hypothetical protein
MRIIATLEEITWIIGLIGGERSIGIIRAAQSIIEIMWGSTGAFTGTMRITRIIDIIRTTKRS